MAQVLDLLMILALTVLALRPHAQASTPTVDGPRAFLSSPIPGQALQGSVSVSGSTRVPGFKRAELSFAYQNDPRPTWFLIKTFNEPSDESLLTDWDTTTLTDGVYELRVLIFQDSGQGPIEILIPGLRVRNYTPIETDTPTPTLTSQPGESPIPTPIPTTTMTSTPIPRPPTPLPTNAAIISEVEIAASMGKGVLIVGLSFVFGVTYLGLRALLHRRQN